MSDAMREKIERVLSEYRCQHTSIIEGEEGCGLPLADALTPPGASSIQLGKHEIHLIADRLAWELFGAASQPSVCSYTGPLVPNEFGKLACPECGVIPRAEEVGRE